MKRASKYKYSSVAVLCLFLIVYAFVWNAARKEVYYLCGNFSVGVDQLSVIKQLETADLSDYVRTEEKTGLKIIFSSDLNFSFYKCSIKTNKNGKVSEAIFS